MTDTLTCTAAEWLATCDTLTVMPRRVVLTTPAGQMHARREFGRVLATVAGKAVSIPGDTTGGRDTTVAILEARWPGITFTLPPPVRGEVAWNRDAVMAAAATAVPTPVLPPPAASSTPPPLSPA